MAYLLGVGEQFPSFEKKAVVSLEAGKEFATVSNDFDNEEGRWTVIFWWPKDFSAVCPSELVAFNQTLADFKSRNASVLGFSTDTELVHLAWRTYNPALKDLRFPLVEDTNKALASELGILHEAGIAYRVTYIIDPKNVIRWLSVGDLAIGRGTEEILRMLDALQSGGLCPVNWKKGEDMIKM
jgi:lipoyl-dependent peroxiredoxin subunit C